MRTKNFLILLCIIIITIFVIILSPAGQQNDSFKNIVSQTHQQFSKLQENLRVTQDKKLEIDPKYLAFLGFTAPIYNGTKQQFAVVTYTLGGRIASTILFLQNIAAKLPNESLIVYDLGLSDTDLHSLQAYCNSSKCSVLTYDLSRFPSYVVDEREHAFRPIIIQDVLQRVKTILFLENSVRIRTQDKAKELMAIKLKTEKGSGVMGWTTVPQAVSSRTHYKMFDYFETNADNFIFMPMVTLTNVFFSDTVIDRVMLPWIKCALTPECIGPIGAQSNGCKYNKKPQYRYSGCHGYDESAFNIILGLEFKFDETKFSMRGEPSLFYTETNEQATKFLENKRKNISDTSEHPFTEE